MAEDLRAVGGELHVLSANPAVHKLATAVTAVQDGPERRCLRYRRAESFYLLVHIPLAARAVDKNFLEAALVFSDRLFVAGDGRKLSVDIYADETEICRIVIDIGAFPVERHQLIGKVFRVLQSHLAALDDFVLGFHHKEIQHAQIDAALDRLMRQVVLHWRFVVQGAFDSIVDDVHCQGDHRVEGIDVENISCLRSSFNVSGLLP